MKVSRMTDDPRFIVIAVSDIDELVKKRKAEEKIQEERIIYARLHAITGNFLVIYVVDPVTGTYREFSSTDGFTESLRQAKEGRDFFRTAREEAAIHNAPADLNRFLAVFTKENVLKEIEANGIFTFGYCLLMNGKPIHVSEHPFDKALVAFGTSPYHAELAEKTMRIALAFLHSCADIRRSGSAALDLAYLACGRHDAYFELTLKPWDYAAGSLIVQEAGGIFCQPASGDLRYDRSAAILAASAAVAGEAVSLFMKYAG
ncbi:MAG: hypothetical protein IKS32_04935 [Solobacterium sp.]|nr:hypothetical protein [Solobacterium sp.]